MRAMRTMRAVCAVGTTAGVGTSEESELCVRGGGVEGPVAGGFFVPVPASTAAAEVAQEGADAGSRVIRALTLPEPVSVVVAVVVPPLA